MIQTSCQFVPSTDVFAPNIIRYLDCQAQTLGSQGYQALASPSSSVFVLLSGLLTLQIAFIGYRMLFGHMLSVKEGVLTFVKIGLVLSLSTSWPAYQRVIYDVVLHEPASLMAEIGVPSGLPGSSRGLVEHIDRVDDAMLSLNVYGVGQLRDTSDVRQASPPIFPGFDNFALGASRVVFLSGVIGSFAFLRILAGLLLALGPLFIAFLLFEGTRGIFEGWLCGLITAAFGALSVAIVLSIELDLLEPWLSFLLNLRQANLPIGGAPGQLLVTALVFFAIYLAMLTIMGRIAFRWKLPFSRLRGEGSYGSYNENDRSALRTSSALIPGRSRASAISDAITTNDRLVRDMSDRSSADGGLRVSANASPGSDGDTHTGHTIPLGHSFSRRVGTHISTNAVLRDGF